VRRPATPTHQHGRRRVHLAVTDGVGLRRRVSARHGRCESGWLSHCSHTSDVEADASASTALTPQVTAIRPGAGAPRR